MPLAMQADEKAAAEASARREEEQQREAERKAALKERADSYKAQEASRLQVHNPCIPIYSLLSTLAWRLLYPIALAALTSGEDQGHVRSDDTNIMEAFWRKPQAPFLRCAPEPQLTCL